MCEMIEFKTIGYTLSRDTMLKERAYNKVLEMLVEASKTGKALPFLEDDLNTLYKLMGEANKGRFISKYIDGVDYCVEKITFIFPIGTSKKFMKKWLENNDYPSKSTHYKATYEDDDNRILFTSVFFKKHRAILYNNYNE